MQDTLGEVVGERIGLIIERERRLNVIGVFVRKFSIEAIIIFLCGLLVSKT